MPTVGEVYTPIVAAIQDGNHDAARIILLHIGRALWENHPDRCKPIAEGVAAARTNLLHYSGYFDGPTAGI